MNEFKKGLSSLESAIEKLHDKPEIQKSAEKVKDRIIYLENNITKGLSQDQQDILDYRKASLTLLTFHAKNTAFILSKPSLDLIQKYKFYALTASDKKYKQQLAIFDFFHQNGLRLAIVVLIAGFGMLLNNSSQPAPVKWVFCIMTLLGVASFLVGGFYGDYVKSHALSQLMLELSDKIGDLVDLTNTDGLMALTNKSDLIDVTNKDSTLAKNTLNYTSSNIILFNQDSVGLRDFKDSKEAEELESQAIKYPIG